MSQIILTEGVAPVTPPTGKSVAYVKTDGRWYWKDDAGVETPFKAVGVGSGDLLADGTVPLTADWDVAAFSITALRFHSDEITLSPFTVVSNTLVANLNADLLDGQEGAWYTDYVDAAVVGLLDHKGGYDADTNTPDLDTAPSGILKGDAYVVTVAGTFYAVALEIGDWLYAIIDDPASAAGWTIVQGNLAGTLLASGTVPLAATWDMGSFDITMDNLHVHGIAIQNANGLYVDGLDTGSLNIGGGDSITAGGVHTLYGQAHSSKASDWEFSAPAYSAGNIRLHFDYSALTFDFKAHKVIGILASNKVITGTTYTILAADLGFNLIFTNAAAIAVTLPDTLDTDFECAIIQTTAAGIPTVTPATDTINGAGTGVAPAAQWKAMYLNQYAATEWLAVL